MTILPRTPVMELSESEQVTIRRGSIYPRNTKRRDSSRIADLAVEHYAGLRWMWEITHGETGRRYRGADRPSFGGGSGFHPNEVAHSVRYVASEDLFLLILQSGQRVAIPREELQDVADASVEEAADVSLEMLNSAVHWEKLDVDFSLKGLAAGRRGNERWMKQLAARRGRHMRLSCRAG